jgi:plasmid stability protein
LDKPLTVKTIHAEYEEPLMARILIRDLSDETVRRLKDHPAQHGHSLEKEARLILAHAAGISFSEARRLARRWHKRLAGQDLPDSAGLIRKDREQ